MLTFTILQGTAPKEKTERSREAKELKIYCVRCWSVFICSRYSYSMSAICASNIRPNFSSNRRRCILFSEMDGS